ncbi:MAG: nucleotidyl transferase AbiEii/AbiGii toxin family protein [Cellulomonadaceae bacterium]|nr:nucleotidyl transferase AbiEii/AbiGii toxin family protein [Cellulomonadaceae bacterium]
MSDRLRMHPAELSLLIDATAKDVGLPVPFVEKDFWVTEVLRAASAQREIRMPDGHSATVSFIFKGGTSLSRVYGIIERFSEDVDLLAVFPVGSSPNARHKVLKQVDADVTRHLGVAKSDVTVGSSTTGVKRYTTYQYPATGATGDALKEGVLLELGSRGGTHPTGVYPYRSMVADYAAQHFGEGPEVWEEFEPFDVEVLAPERTMLEKLASLHAAAVTGDLDKLRLFGRHLYDIGRLLDDIRVTSALDAMGPHGLLELVDDVNTHAVEAGFPGAPRPSTGYADSPALAPAGDVHEAIRHGYEAAQPLIHGARIPLNEVFNIIEANRNRL